MRSRQFAPPLSSFLASVLLLAPAGLSLAAPADEAPAASDSAAHAPMVRRPGAAGDPMPIKRPPKMPNEHRSTIDKLGSDSLAK
ncbi:hypothetical protein [Chitinasiproducens palmae]|uniref:Uncharacterized protein n=1 Tax=Chitinasiproducens palmae TaxID=1770053 RepID=A0A1H2PT69_9BURK|nr:hypothetical protein [Chitinasiproducens palmae]SDV49847.1 hypothetical protein SAMN05216551_109190 [Chitinasiproducens palmae]